MAEFEIKYEIREPRSRNPRTGAVKYQSSGYMSNPITVTANDESEARKKAAKHPKLLEKKSRINASIPDDVQSAGGKARHKIKSIKRISGGGGLGLSIGSGGPTSTGLKGTMPKYKALKNGGAVMSGRGPKYKGQT